MSKQLPILFSSEMVRAILEGRKTQTRRPVKYHPFAGEPDAWCPRAAGGDPTLTHIIGDYRRFARFGAGDMLYVRESYAPNYFGFGKHGYRADWTSEAADVVPEPKWTPSIHMPKRASRIWLRVTDVRLERVQDISEGDAMSEGMHWSDGAPIGRLGPMSLVVRARDEFRRAWDAAYPGSWDRSDWVWVYELERVEAPNA